MATTFDRRETQDEIFKKMVLVSAILHAAFFLSVTVKTYFFPSEPIDLEQAIRVDLVGLPDKVQELPELNAPKESAPVEKAPPEPVKPEPPKPEPAKPKLPPKEIAKPAAKAPPLVIPKPDAKQVKQKKSLEDAMSKIRQLEEQEAQEQAAAAERQRQERLARAKQALIRGNVVSPGNSLTGIQKAQFDDYIGQVKQHMQRVWALPSWLGGANLKATAVIYLNPNGQVTRREIVRSSGDPRFDAYVLQTIDSASPFPRPPEKFVDYVQVNGLGLRFPD